MRLFGLTGGMGMGKSTCAELLGQAGIPVVDTDTLAHDLTRPGTPAVVEITAAFGPSVLDPSGGLNRSSLAQIVFADASARQRLEAILHPKILAAWQTEVERWKTTGASVGVVVIPLLFETHAEKFFDATVCVACSQVTQASRLATRGWSTEEISRRIAAQLPVATKMDQADYVIWSEGNLAALEGQLRRVIVSQR